MSDTSDNDKPPTKTSARIIYILYLVSIIIGITAIIGLVMAYVNKDDGSDWLKTHYRFQIRTFWIGALYLFISVVLSQVIIGLFVLLFWFIWLVVRCAKGLKYLEREEGYPNPVGWMF